MNRECFLSLYQLLTCSPVAEVNTNEFLLFNKTDLYNIEDKKKHKELVEVYKKIGYKTISFSALKDDLTKVKDVMKEKVNLISGHSGVGKSTLINKLQPDLHINTKEVSESYNQGQHTTTFSELYELDFGSSIIDTPGIKGFGLVSLICRTLKLSLSSISQIKYPLSLVSP